MCAGAGLYHSTALDPEPHPLEVDQPLLARVHGASLTQRTVLGSRSGLPVRRLGLYGDPEVECGARRPSAHLHARHLGFDLHAAVRVAARDGPRLESLCRYLLRPPIAHDRLTRRADGRLVLRMKTPYRDGTTHLLFDPLELVEKLAALVPRPKKNLVLYHGVLAANAKLRARVVAHGRDAPDASRPPPLSRKEGGPNVAWAHAARLRPRRPRVRKVQAGTSLDKPSRISSRGNRYLRAALYMLALTLAHRDDHGHAFYAAMVGRGKKPMQATVAVMRKLLHVLHAMFRKDELWSGARAFRGTASVVAPSTISSSEPSIPA